MSKIRKNKPSKPWFNEDLKELRNKTRYALKALKQKKSMYDYNNYSFLRNAYHKQLKWAEKCYQDEKTQELVNSTYQDGLNKLYSKMKIVCGNSIDISKFLSYCKKLFLSHNSSEFTLLPTADNMFHPLTKTITNSEISNVLKKFKSKAKSTSGISPHDLKILDTSITPFLRQIFNDILLGYLSVPLKWLEASMFFIYKGSGDKMDPEKYRTICVQNPILKALMATIKCRLDNYAEANSLYPTYQFGFRKNRSTVSAATILHQTIEGRLNQKKRTYACFIDFKKCFDSVDRNILFIKLQKLGIPPSLCKIIDFIYRNMKFYINSDTQRSEHFTTSIGLPQGCCLSPTMFSLFAHDIGDCFSHQGLDLNGTKIKYLQYADDLVILCDNQYELQSQIDNLAKYCSENSLKLNEKKTKILVFHKGRMPNCSFYLGNEELEIVSEFKYLGFIFTCQLSFSKHVHYLNLKAKARIGLMFSRLPLKQLSLDKVMLLFKIYVEPIYLYGVAIWMSRYAKNYSDEIDAVMRRYLKRYLMVPLHSNNAITDHLTNQVNFTKRLSEMAKTNRNNMIFPAEFNNLKLSLWDKIPEYDEGNKYENIPSWFWGSRIYNELPTNYKNRKKLTHDLFDINHKEFCINDTFHAKLDHNCYCKICKHPLEHYHERFCQDNLSYCRRVKVCISKLKNSDIPKEDNNMSNGKRERKRNVKFYGDTWMN